MEENQKLSAAELDSVLASASYLGSYLKPKHWFQKDKPKGTERQLNKEAVLAKEAALDAFDYCMAQFCSPTDAMGKPIDDDGRERDFT